jgi:hypothetical protein
VLVSADGLTGLQIAERARLQGTDGDQMAEVRQAPPDRAERRAARRRAGGGADPGHSAPRSWPPR